MRVEELIKKKKERNCNESYGGKEGCLESTIYF